MVRQKKTSSRKNLVSENSVRLLPALILASSLITSPALAQQVTNGNDSGSGSLREALTSAVDNETISFGDDIEVTLSSGAMVYDKNNLTISGNGDSSVITRRVSNLTSQVAVKKNDLDGLRSWLADSQNDGFQAEVNGAVTNIINNAALTKISADSPVFYNSAATGSGLSLDKLYLTEATSGSVISFSSLDGGGVVGTGGGTGPSSIGSITNTVFSGLSVDGGDYIFGGGIVGANSYASSAAVGTISDSVFNNLEVQLNGSSGLLGGGIIGASDIAPGTSATVGAISGSLFNGVNISSAPGITGGGVIGAYSGGNSGGSSTVNSISGSLFTNISVSSSGGSINGGGVLGAYADGSGSSSAIGSVNNSVFNGIKVNAAGVLFGGVIGAVSDNASVMGNIENSVFANISARSTYNEVYAGVLYAGGLDSELVIKNSVFVDTLAQSNSSTASSYGGAIAVDTSYATANANGHELTLEATGGQTTLFQNNRIISGTTSANATNSVYMGRVGVNYSQADAVLNIKTAAGGLVDLRDPLAVDLHSSASTFNRFTMTVDGPGNFYWGGSNDFEVGAGSSINLKNGSQTTLLAGFKNRDRQDNLTLNLEDGSKLMVELTASAGDAPLLEASAVNIAPTATIGVNTKFTYSDAVVENNNGRSVLKISADNLTGTPTLEGGIITVGVFNYQYDLSWVDQVNDPYGQYSATFKLLNGGGGDGGRKPSYNKEIAASQSTMAPGVLATYLPAGTLLHEHMSGFFRENHYNQYAYGDFSGSHSLWLTPTYAHAKRDGNSRRLGYELDTYGATLGWDFRPDAVDNGVFGLAVSFFDQNYDGDRTDMDGKTVMLQGYGGFMLPEDFELMLNLGYGWADYDQKRRVRGQKLSSDYDANLFNIGLELARRFMIDECLSFRPFVGYDYMNVDVDGYREKNGDGTYNLRVNGYSQELHRFRAGVGADWINDQGVKLGAEVYYQGLAGDRKAETDIRFVNDPSGTKWVSLADPLEKNNFGLGLSASVPLDDNFSLGAGYKLGLGKHTTAHQGNLTIGYDF